MLKVSALTAITAVIGLLASGPVLAQTPDGDTPAVEDVCSVLEGVQFGLCNAYCEAMDCDGSNPAASPIACDKVLDRFRQVSSGTELPPCVEPPITCPCWTTAILNEALANDTGALCQDGGDGEFNDLFMQTLIGPAVSNRLGVVQVGGLVCSWGLADGTVVVPNTLVSVEVGDLCKAEIRASDIWPLCVFF